MSFPTPTPSLSYPGFAVRRAVRSDVPAIVAILLEDPVSAARVGHTPSTQGVELERYYAAFDEVDLDPHQFLAVIIENGSSSTPNSHSHPPSPSPSPATSSEAHDAGVVVGTAQLTLIPGLTYGGALRLQIEGVHVVNHLQGRGLGAAFFTWMDNMGRGAGVTIAQLTTDKRRAAAHRFYERLGWTATHEGMKKHL